MFSFHCINTFVDNLHKIILDVLPLLLKKRPSGEILKIEIKLVMRCSNKYPKFVST